MKRFLALLLTVCMVFGLVPASAEQPKIFGGGV